MAASIVRRASHLLPLRFRVVQSSSCIKKSSRSPFVKQNCVLRINARPLSSTASLQSSETDIKSSEIDSSSVNYEDSPFSKICNPYVQEVEQCLLCKANVPLSYKNVQLLSQFVSPNTGHIHDRKITKLCQFQQDRVTRQINIARKFGMMPFIYRETIFLKDPSLYSIPYIGNPDIGSSVSLPLSTEDYEAQQEDLKTSMKGSKALKKPVWKGGKLISKTKKKN